MNQTAKQKKDQNTLFPSTLISLFQQKGYKCEEIAEEDETIYVMKLDLLQKEKSFIPKPRIFVH